MAGFVAARTHLYLTTQQYIAVIRCRDNRTDFIVKRQERERNIMVICRYHRYNTTVLYEATR
jgi:hypothetical protein